MEIPDSKQDVKLFRRFPDDEQNEKDFGPGYIKLYSVDGKGVQVVFRNHGTMKVRAAHVIRVTDRPDEDQAAKDAWKSMFDVSFEKELRYTATGDTADMASQTSACYGQDQVTRPVDFPLSFEFDTDDARDDFVAMLQEQLDRLHADTKDGESSTNSNTGIDESNEETSCSNKADTNDGESSTNTNTGSDGSKEQNKDSNDENN